MPTYFDEVLTPIELEIIRRASKLKPDSVAMLHEYMQHCKAFNQYPYKLMCRRIQNTSAIVQLTRFEQDLCGFIGDQRTAAARAAGKENMIQSGSDHKIEKLGIATELAYGSMLNMFPYETFQILARSTAEDAGDFTHQPGNICVDVKGSDYFAARLFLATWKRGSYSSMEDYLSKVHVLALFTGPIDLAGVEKMKTDMIKANCSADDIATQAKIGRFMFRGYYSTRDMVSHPAAPLKYRGNPVHWVRQSSLVPNLQAALRPATCEVR